MLDTWCLMLARDVDGCLLLLRSVWEVMSMKNPRDDIQSPLPHLALYSVI